MNGGPPSGAGTGAAKAAAVRAPGPRGRDVLREVSGSENREFTEAPVRSVADGPWLPSARATRTRA